MLAAGAYSGPRAVCGAVAQPAKNARHVMAATRRVRIRNFGCWIFISYQNSDRPLAIVPEKNPNYSNFADAPSEQDLSVVTSAETGAELFGRPYDLGSTTPVRVDNVLPTRTESGRSAGHRCRSSCFERRQLNFALKCSRPSHRSPDTFPAAPQRPLHLGILIHFGGL